MKVSVTLDDVEGCAVDQAAVHVKVGKPLMAGFRVMPRWPRRTREQFPEPGSEGLRHLGRGCVPSARFQYPPDHQSPAAIGTSRECLLDAMVGLGGDFRLAAGSK